MLEEKERYNHFLFSWNPFTTSTDIFIQCIIHTEFKYPETLKFRPLVERKVCKDSIIGNLSQDRTISWYFKTSFGCAISIEHDNIRVLLYDILVAHEIVAFHSFSSGMIGFARYYQNL